MVVNTIDKDRGNASKDGFIIRREAVEHGIPLFTSLDTADAIVRVMESRAFQLTLFNGEHMLRQKDEKPLQEGQMKQEMMEIVQQNSWHQRFLK